MFVQMCMDVFGSTYQRIFIDNQIAQTNYKYGERQHYRGTNVVFPNGNVDPWHALGLYGSADDSVVAYLINGTAHCADMYPARAADVPGLKVVRDIIDTNIGKWLSQANVGTTTGAPSTATVATAGSSTATVATAGTSKPTVATGGPATSTATTPAAPVTNTTAAPTASPAIGSPSTSPATVQTSTKSAATSSVILSFIAIFASYLL